jgi:hypothetical protein
VAEAVRADIARDPLARFTLLLLPILAECHRATAVYTVAGPEQACAGELVLEFTNHLSEPVQVGWIPMEQLRAAADRVAPIWLGTLGLGSARYPVAGPGRVIFRTANPAAAQGERHQVSHRVLCRMSRR